ncbi:hypothetical protein [Mycobacterium phage WXIN]|nr:hypothetical protein [Mycobacterium phage WXIN]
MTESSALVTIDEVAQMTNTPINTVRYWKQINYGPRFAKIGRRVMARRSDVEAWIEAQFEESA